MQFTQFAVTHSDNFLVEFKIFVVFLLGLQN